MSEQRLRDALQLAIDLLAHMIDPDPEKGILTRLKLEGEKQGVPLTATYDATVDLIEVLKADLDADDGPWPKPVDALGEQDLVELIVPESLARVFEERCLGANTRGLTRLSPPMRFSAGGLPSYIIEVTDDRFPT